MTKRNPQEEIREQKRKERWKCYPRCNDYVVSTKGRIVTLRDDEPKIMNPRTNQRGYLDLTISINGEPKKMAVHTLVLETFIAEKPGELVCHHKDGAILNNRLENLAWVTRSENTLEGYKLRGISLTNEQRDEVCVLYKNGIYSQGELADIFNASQGTIGRIIRAEINHKEDVNTIFKYWQGAGIIKHKTINNSHRAILKALQEYSADEIVEAIGNYATIIKSTNYFFQYKWGCSQFLQRGLYRFVSENDPFDNFATEEFRRNGSKKDFSDFSEEFKKRKEEKDNE